MSEQQLCKNCKHLEHDRGCGIWCGVHGNNQNYDCPKFEYDWGILTKEEAINHLNRLYHENKQLQSELSRYKEVNRLDVWKSSYSSEDALITELQDKCDKKQKHIVLLEDKIHRMREQIKKLEGLYHYRGYTGGSGNIKKEYYQREKLLKIENDQLKQEYQKLKHRHSLLHDICCDLECDCSSLQKDVESLEKENEQLKKELKRCRDWINSDKNDYELTLSFIKNKGYSLKDVLEYEKELKNK